MMTASRSTASWLPAAGWRFPGWTAQVLTAAFPVPRLDLSRTRARICPVPVSGTAPGPVLCLCPDPDPDPDPDLGSSRAVWTGRGWNGLEAKAITALTSS